MREHLRLNLAFLLPGFQEAEIPKVDYIEKKRVEMGLISEIYSSWEIAQSKEIHQMGWDETKMEGKQSTLNL